MKCSLFFFFNFLLISYLYSQTDIFINKEVDGLYNMRMSCNNSGYCDYLIYMTFELNNAYIKEELPFLKNVKRGYSNNILTIYPSIPTLRANFWYKYKAYKGRMNAKVDKNFIYLMPLKGQNISVTKAVTIEELLEKEKLQEWFSLSFIAKERDTVYASRAGFVNKVENKFSLPEDNTIFTRKTNYVEIYHADGTFANYNLLNGEFIFVKKGQRVLPGDPIGLVENVYGEPYLYFSLYYLVVDKSKFNTVADIQIKYTSINPKILTLNGINQYLENVEQYSSFYPDSIINLELTKKEKKKRIKK